MRWKYLFGPVASRRLGRSLGVDIIPAKTCPFDCVYCEVGRTTRRTKERASYVQPDEVLSELEGFFDGGGQADYVTFSGSGEPTLSRDLGRLIRETKKRFGVNVAVITNGALLGDPEVRAELAEADVVMPSLDSAREESFEAVNRPLAGLGVREVIEGLVKFTKEFRGRAWLEVLLVTGVNDSDRDIEALAKAIERIRPERVQLNTVIRPPAEKDALPASREKLEEVAARLSRCAPTEIVAPAALKKAKSAAMDREEAVVETLRRRPCTAEDLASGLSIGEGELSEILDVLLCRGLIEKARFGQGEFYQAAGRH